MLDADEVAERYARIYRALGPRVGERHGYVTDAEAERVGLDPALREAAIDAGLILRIAPGLLNVHGNPGNTTLADRAIRAWLTTGELAVVSHESALALLGLGGEETRLHLSVPTASAGAIAELHDVVLHVADVPETERTWAARAPVPVTTATRTLTDCASAGLDDAVLATARAEASRCGLLPGPEPVLADPVLRLALLTERLPLREITPRLDRLSAAELAAWAASVPLPAEEQPTERLRWSKDALLRAAVPAGEDGVIRALSGIDAFPGLVIVDLRLSRLQSLEPLVGLEALVALHVGVTDQTSLDPLLRCPALRRVRLDGYAPTRHAGTRAALEARGVVFDLVAGDTRPSAAPFTDPMLKLAVLEALADDLELPELIAIDEDELDREHLDKLLAIELSPEQLASVTELVWSGGGMRLQHLLWPQFSGEEEAFAIRSLKGIAALPSLRSLRLEGMPIDPAAAELAALRARGVDVVLG